MRQNPDDQQFVTPKPEPTWSWQLSTALVTNGSAAQTFAHSQNISRPLSVRPEGWEKATPNNIQNKCKFSPFSTQFVVELNTSLLCKI